MSLADRDLASLSLSATSIGWSNRIYSALRSIERNHRGLLLLFRRQRSFWKGRIEILNFEVHLHSIIIFRHSLNFSLLIMLYGCCVLNQSIMFRLNNRHGPIFEEISRMRGPVRCNQQRTLIMFLWLSQPVLSIVNEAGHILCLEVLRQFVNILLLLVVCFLNL